MIAVFCWAAPSAAQSNDAAMAESLFRDAKRLSGEHKFAEACPKFAESYKLDPGLGTLLNLAMCHESEGKLATAWAEFSEASARAKREGDNDRAQLADEHVRALEPKLAHISINVAPGTAAPGMVVKFDSREMSTAALGLQIPLDPGKHQLEVSAPGRQSYAQTIDAPAPGSTVAITVPVLQPTTGAPTPAAAPASAASAPPPAVAPAPAPAPWQPAMQAPSGPSHTAVILTGVATGAFVIGAVVTGVLYAQKRSSFDDANHSLDPSRFDKRDQAGTMGTVNLVFTGGALVSAGLFAYFLVTQGSHESAPATAKLNVLPVVSTNGAGVSVGGAL
ncbi:MAG TPA: hypothetical protein VGI10_24430 [Polyangiaceae bacterium]|jgi:hypothetical protein